jgi:hypothetical protein
VESRAGLEDLEKYFDPTGTQTPTPQSSRRQPVAIPTTPKFFPASIVPLLLPPEQKLISAKTNDSAVVLWCSGKLNTVRLLSNVGFTCGFPPQVTYDHQNNVM